MTEEMRKLVAECDERIAAHLKQLERGSEDDDRHRGAIAALRSIKEFVAPNSQSKADEEFGTIDISEFGN